ncbi:helix-turn-helix transcriptional regulator [Myroides marinus]|uniref:AraC family transcriptional regulator n=1 Tax=Myroides marinus TaxID=703342 RepID=UPI002574D356|nr:AraC family transcriptional regulator [Myroides marinus]MDM1348029.1 helix-turn-helix transcriptional regulator [Myroides marinus]MDM1350722.1 helix-turn-helix transcriptional regulator [Myroides marinus]MDM1354510.1 helix-turn-helix transcriptional regulator [Myroides marinus]MDM1357929.1 helix-turn-helix transcriptional regulator [Myroides marinus]MDM1365354.1 helix-turn-helix transcriptional regulator [Myroides marinus]
MQNANIKCGLTEKLLGVYEDTTEVQAYVWYENNYVHDEYQHAHQRYQLTYVEQGYQYLHVDHCIYLVPQYHIAWIPSGQQHATTSTAKNINLKVLLYRDVPKDEFYERVHIFSAPTVLREMLQYASKWNRMVGNEEEKEQFLQAILVSLKSFCDENQSLQLPVPVDHRLVPVCAYINEHFTSNLDLDELALKSTMSVRNLQRLFKQETGITLQKYLQIFRILKSIELLDTGELTLSEIAYKIGYKSLVAFRNSYFDIMKVYPKVKK